MKIKEAIKNAKTKLIENKIEDASIVARVLLQFVLKNNRNELILKQEQEIQQEKILEYEVVVKRVIEGIPLQYITKTSEFYGLHFYVDKNVLIPQPDTEILVEEVIKIAKKESKILDICTGSGCIGISIAKNLENAQITLSDISENALKIAEKNVKNNNVYDKIKIIKSDMFENIKEKYNIIVSNPPYIETDTIKTLSKQVQNEPKIALDGGKDGLEFYRKLLTVSPKHLEKNGVLCIEIGYNQREQVIKIAKKTKEYEKIETIKDLSGNNRVLTLIKK